MKNDYDFNDFIAKCFLRSITLLCSKLHTSLCSIQALFFLFFFFLSRRRYWCCPKRKYQTFEFPKLFSTPSMK